MNFSPQDRLFGGVTKPQQKRILKAMKIPVLDVQAKLNDDFRDEIELLNLKLEDANDANKVLNDINANLTLRNGELQARVESERMLRFQQDDVRTKLNTAEHEVVKLKRDLATEVSNRDHFRSLVSQQDAFIREAKIQIERYKKSQGDTLVTKTKEAEHLANQAVRLNTDNVALKADVVRLIDENTKFQEQTTRLIEEKRKLDAENRSFECWGCKSGEHGAHCGGCLGCLLRQAEYHAQQSTEEMNRLAKVLEKERFISALRWNTIVIFAALVRDLKAFPTVWWNRAKKAALIAASQKQIDAIQADINNARTEKK